MRIRENTTEVVKKVFRDNNVQVSDQTIEETILSHPNYPSFKSICDTLKFWEIETYPVRISLKDLSSCNSPIIVHLEGNTERVAYIPNYNYGREIHYYLDSGPVLKMSQYQFDSEFSGAAIFIDAKNSVKELNYIINRQKQQLEKYMSYFGVSAVSIFILFQININFIQIINSWYWISLIVIKLLGVILTIDIFLIELNPTIQKKSLYCFGGDNRGCGNLINSNSSLVFGYIQWGDIGLSYFIGGLLLLVLFPLQQIHGTVFLVSLVSLFFIFYSIYYQLFVSRRLCALCFGVVLLLVAELVTLILKVELAQLSYQNIIETGLIYAFVGYLIITAKMNLKLHRQNRQLKISNKKFLRNPNNIKNILRMSKKISKLPNSTVFQTGHNSRGFSVTFFFSLHCMPCREMFAQLKRTFIKSNVRLQFVISLYNLDDNFAINLKKLCEENSKEEVVNFIDKSFEALLNKKDRKSYHRNIKNESCFSEIKEKQSRIFSECKITRTPTIAINQSIISPQFSFLEIEYIIEYLEHSI